MDSAATWIQVVLAVSSAVGALIAWWRSNLSTEAKNAAEDAERRASESEERAAKSLQAMESIADSLKPDLLTCVPDSTGSARRVKVSNSSGAPLTITELVNEADFLRIDMAGRREFPVTMKPNETIEFQIVRAFGHPTPPNLVFQIDGRAEPYYAGI